MPPATEEKENNNPGCARLYRAAVLAFTALVLAALFPRYSPAQEVRLFKITSYEGYLGFGYEYQREMWDKIQRSQNLLVKNHRFTEEPSLEVSSYLYHPNVAIIKTSLTWTQRQEFLSNESAPNYNTDLAIKDFSADAELFKRLPVNFQLFASRITTTIDNTYWSKRDLITRRLGARINVRSRLLPLSLQSSTTEQEGFGFYYYRERRKDLRLNGSIDNKFVRTTFAAETADIWRSEQNINSMIEQAELQNIVNPQGSGRVQLLSSVHYYRQKNGYNTTNYGIIENLNIRLTPRLTSQLSYSNSSGTSQNLSNKTEVFQGMLSHRLYDSLLSSLELFRTSFGFDRGKQANRGGRTSISYHKFVPFGKIEAGYALRYREEWQNFEEDLAAIINEPHQFIPGVPLFLDRQLIKPETIEIRDETGIILYEEGIDYITRIFSSYTEIIILPAGNIPRDAVLQVSYQFEVDPALSFKTLSNQWNTSINIKNKLIISYKQSTDNQTLLGGIDAGNLQDIDQNTLTVQAIIKGSTTTMEYQKYGAEINPFYARRLNEYFFHNFSNKTQLNLQADYTVIDFTGTPITAVLWDVIIGFKSRLSRSMKLNLRSYYREHRGQGDASVIYGLENELRYRFRMVELYASCAYEYGRIEGFEKRNRILLKTQLRRYF